MYKYLSAIFLTLLFILTASAQTIERSTGFPSDFPVIKDEGGLGAGTNLTGFGGDLALDKIGNSKNITRIPVILLHGNGGNAAHNQWGMVATYNMLKNIGYNDSEIWAVSYFGENNNSAQMNDPYKTNINDVRNFIEALRKYLNVDKIDIIAHSLGSVLAKGYILGLDNTGKWGGTTSHHENVGTLVTLASAFYGLGSYSQSEFKSGGPFEKSSHIVDGIVDDTPYGFPVSAQIGNYKKATALDNGSITYVSIIGKGDFIDSQNSMTGHLEGANLNKTFDLGSGLAGHQKIINDKEVFDTYFPYLSTKASETDRAPEVMINPTNGNFNNELEISLTGTNRPNTIFYSLNHGEFIKYISPFKINSDAMIEAFAENKFGRGQTVISNFKKVEKPLYEEVTSTLTEHAQSGRITWQDFPTYLAKYGAQAKVTFYKLADSTIWTDILPN
jgi:pimeloyl-ACP methyl ester carboxylesterase